jgi:hypothetical protein
MKQAFLLTALDLRTHIYLNSTVFSYDSAHVLGKRQVVHRGIRLAYGDTVASGMKNIQFFPHTKCTVSALSKMNCTVLHAEREVIDSSENYTKHINTPREKLQAVHTVLALL